MGMHNIAPGVSSQGTPATPLISESFESPSVGTAISTLGFTRTSGVISTDQASNGSKSAKISITYNTDGDQSYGGARTLDTPLVQGDEIWVQSKFFFPNGWDFGNAGNAGMGGTAPRTKFFRLHTKTNAGTHLGYNDLYLYKWDANQTRWNWIYEGVQQWAFNGLDASVSRPQAPYTGISRGQWVKVEYYIKLHATPGSAIVRVWVDNALQVNITDLATLVNSTDKADEVQYCTYWNGGAPATQSSYFDDFKIYTSASRPSNTDLSGNAFIG